MITLICCYNDRKCLEKMLIPSIETQKIQPQLILIDNNKKRYKSAAQAYNKEFKEAKGDILVFCHQDIAFDDSGFLQNVEKAFNKNPDSILGLAGIKKDGKMYSNLKYFGNKEYITQKRVIGDAEKVESLDECFVAIPKKHFMKLLFNEEVCDYWHLYVVELCYRAKKDLSINSNVIPLEAYHKIQEGNGLEVDSYYLSTINKICKNYKKSEKEIYAPCYIVPTGFLKKHLKFIKTRLKIKLKNK